MPREHSYECECGPCSVHKIFAKRQAVEQNDEIGGCLALFTMLFGGIFLFMFGYVVLLFISMVDIMTFGLFNWDWLWWDNNAWKEF